MWCIMRRQWRTNDMPWETRTREEMRREFMREFTEEGANRAEVCRSYGISRKTGYKWLKRYKEEGESGLKERSRAPLTKRVKLEEEVITRMVSIRVKHPSWGAEKIRACMKREGYKPLPGRATINRILKRCGMIKVKKRRQRVKNVRMEGTGRRVEEVNEEWTIDFKGWWLSKDGKRRCNPLTIRDAKSRYILGVTLLRDMREETVKRVMEKVFREYGLPERIRSDCGSPFASVQSILMISKLSAWWIKLGIEPVRGRVGCPQDNGGHERMHLDMKRELEEMRVDEQSEIDEWVKIFNNERPHAALGGETPREHYRKSKRRYTGEREYEYEGMEVRVIDRHGDIRLRGMDYFVSEAIRGERVGVKEISEGVYEVWFCQYKMGMIDANIEAFIPVQEKGEKLRMVKGRVAKKSDGGGEDAWGGK